MAASERTRELDGVRGVAILLVVVGHGAARYGFGPLAAAGVTLFFVLSGYLITGILLAERALRGSVDLRRFYARRMTRLAPPMLVMLSVITVLAGGYGWATLVHPLTWTTNYALLSGLSPEPFGHSWSLGVEEQFYLVWPIALAGLMSRRRPVHLLALLVAVLLMWRGWLLGAGYLPWAYTSLETAGSAVLLGCLVAVAKWRMSGRSAGLACVLLIVGGEMTGLLIGIDGWMWVPFAVAPVCAVMVAGAESARWLASRPLAWCGTVSYSVYLWHEPVMRLTWDNYHPLGIGFGVLCGIAAWAVIERPVMRLRSRSSERVAVFRESDLNRAAAYERVARD